MQCIGLDIEMETIHDFSTLEEILSVTEIFLVP